LTNRLIFEDVRLPEICLMTKAWRSGAAWVAQMIAQAIAEQGASIAFVAPRADPVSREPSHSNLTRIVTPRELIGQHGKARRAVASLQRIFGGLAAICRLRLTTRTFIFSIPEPLVFTLPLFALLRLTGARVIFIAHDAQPHAWALGERFRFMERGAHALSYRLASTVVALTPTVRDALARDFSVPVDKIAIIPHGPFSIGDVEPMPGTGRLLIFGSLRRNKSILEAIEGTIIARKAGQRVTLVLVGEPLKEEGAYWDQCRAAIAADPAGFDVRVGFLPDEALPELIGSVDAFVLAYQNFNSQSGVGVLAALAGRPVIGTRSGGLGELFDRGMAGTVIDKATPEDIAAAISSFYGRSAAEWQSAASDGALRIAKSLRWDSIADQYIRLARNQPLLAETDYA
jgi:glycosyltransferase involved in cell wall biosynthesis